MKKTAKNSGRNGKGLKNPAAMVVASSPAVQKAVTSQIEVRTEAAKQAASVIPFLIKTGVVVTVIYFAYRAFSNRFVGLGFNTNLPPASITEAQARTKANAIYEAMKGVGADFDTVITNLAGLNYNGWVRLYNAFGKRKTSIPFAEPMTLEEWLLSEFSGSKLQQIRFLVSNVF